jgi:hypothetical protein
MEPLKIAQTSVRLGGKQFECHLSFVHRYFIDYAAGSIVLPSAESVEMRLIIDSAAG